MPEFVNTNPHRVVLAREEGRPADVRIGPGQAFDADGFLADQAGATNGVVRSNSDEAKEYADTGQVQRQRPTADDRPQEALDAIQAAARAANSPLTDRLTGDPAEGTVERTSSDTPAVNAPSVGVTTAAVVDEDQRVIAAGPGPGRPAEGGPYDEAAAAAAAESRSSETEKGAYENARKSYLQAEVDRRNAEEDRGIEVEGSGADGNVVVKDLIKALRADDEARADDAEDNEGGAITSDQVPQAGE